MRRAYHYTRPENYRGIWKHHILCAHSPLIHRPYASEIGIELPRERFIFCMLDSPEPEPWVKTGFLNHLIKNYMKDRYVLLSFEVKEDYPAYVLESKPVYDMWSAWNESNLEYEQIKSSKMFGDAFRKYIDSRTPLKDYKDDFIIPELVVARHVPFSEVRLEKIVTGITWIKSDGFPDSRKEKISYSRTLREIIK